MKIYNQVHIFTHQVVSIPVFTKPDVDPPPRLRFQVVDGTVIDVPKLHQPHQPHHQLFIGATTVIILVTRFVYPSVLVNIYSKL
jgi:hypothetical protein